jgi:hypoxanthine phosphoribosyltransferase
VKLLLSEEQIREGIGKLAGKITTHCEGQPVTLVAVMTGSIILLADLVRQLQLPLELGVVRASSYQGEACRPGQLSIDSTWLSDLSGRHVLIVDDIFDTGRTLRGVYDELLAKWQPRSLRTAVLLRKTGRQEVVMEPDYVGFEIPDVFVVGYGLDYNGGYRNLCHIAAMEADDLLRGEVKAVAP